MNLWNSWRYEFGAAQKGGGENIIHLVDDPILNLPSLFFLDAVNGPLCCNQREVIVYIHFRELQAQV